MIEPTTEEKVVAGLVHLGVLLNVAGLVASIVVYVLYKPKSSFVTRHAKQSIALQVLSFLVFWLVVMAFGFSAITISIGTFKFAPRVTVGLLGVLINGGLQMALLVLAVIASVKAFQGEQHLHPVFGQWVDSLGR